MALLTNLVASLALTRLAVLVVEMLMLNVLPQKSFYTKYKMEVTEDFSDLRDARRRAQEDSQVDMVESSGDGGGKGLDSSDAQVSRGHSHV